MPGNIVSALVRRRHGGDRWAAYEALPAPVRRFLQEAAISFSAIDVVAGLVRHAGDVDVLLAEMHEVERGEILLFARGWKCCHGDYPHLAAAASIVRYDSAKRRRRPSRAMSRCDTL